MAIGDSGSHVPSNVPGHGPTDNSDRVGKHVQGSGDFPGTGDACSQPSAQHPGNMSRDGRDDG